MPKTLKQMLDEVWGHHVAQEEKARRANTVMLIDYYGGDQEKYIAPYIKIDQKLDAFPFYWTKLTSRIIDKKSEVYKLAPQRTFGDKTEQDEPYQDITKKKNIRLKVAEQQTNLLGTIGFRPFKTENNTFDYLMVRDFQAVFDVGIDPVAIRYPVATAANERDVIYMYWSDEFNFLMTADNVTIKETEQLERFGVPEDGINPYGVIPFVYLHNKEIIDDFWNTAGNADDLANANLHINMKLTEMSHKYRFKSFNPVYITGVDAKSSDVKFGYDRLLAIEPADAKVGNLSTDHLFMDDIEVIKFEIQQIERNYHLNIAWGIEGHAPSGFSLIVQNMSHMDDLEDFTDVARDWEDQIVEMERVVGKVDGLTVPEGDLRVDFNEIRQPISQDEKNKKWDFEFKNKLSTRRDYWKSENPDISEEELDEREKALTEEGEKLGTNKQSIDDFLFPAEEE